MTDAAHSFRHPDESDTEWLLRLGQAAEARNALFDISLAQGNTDAITEITAIAIDAATADAAMAVPMDADDLPPSAEELDLALANMKAKAEEQNARLLNGDPEAVAAYLGFEETVHMLDIVDRSGPQLPSN